MKPRDFLLAPGIRCYLTKARHPLLRNYFVLSFPHGEPTALEESDLLAVKSEICRDFRTDSRPVTSFVSRLAPLLNPSC